MPSAWSLELHKEPQSLDTRSKPIRPVQRSGSAQVICWLTAQLGVLKSNSMMSKVLPLPVRFLLASALATASDYGLWMLLCGAGMSPVSAHFISYPFGVLFNFHLQRRFMFTLRRRLWQAFGLAMMISAAGWWAGTILLALLLKVEALGSVPLAAKAIVTVVLFTANFFLKRFAFERRFLGSE